MTSTRTVVRITAAAALGAGAVLAMVYGYHLSIAGRDDDHDEQGRPYFPDERDLHDQHVAWLRANAVDDDPAEDIAAEHPADPDTFTRAAITLWQVGDPYHHTYYGDGVITEVDEYGHLRGTAPATSPGWWPKLERARLQEVPDYAYLRIPARTFAVPAATIARAKQLDEAYCAAMTQENAPLSWQGYGEATDDPYWSELYPADLRGDDEVPPEVRIEGEIVQLWDAIPVNVQAELLDDYRATGADRDHPAYPLLLSARALIESQGDGERPGDNFDASVECPF
jgi:hypothetical protein